jgi:predicted lipoprotein with Yx(FWY)xxD motif
MRKRLDRRLVPLLLVGAVVAVVAVASATSAPGRPTVKVVKTASLGKLLTTSSGLTLYHYTDEKRGKIDCKGGCAKLWPPLLVTSGKKPTLGRGLRAAKLGTIERPDGRTQVTYNGLALYRYAPDRKVGDVKGQGLAKAWYVIAPSGKIVRRAPASAGTPAAPAAPSSDTTPTDTTPAGGGYDYG